MQEQRMFKQMRLAFAGMVLGLLLMAFFVTLTGFNWHSFRHVEQKSFHGQILNYTDKPLRFVHTEGTTNLPAGENSMDTGILDADGLIIDHPVKIGHRVYQHGTFVVCDFGKLTLRTTQQGDVLEGSPGTWLCRM